MVEISLLNKRFCRSANNLRYIHKIVDEEGTRMVFSNDSVPSPETGSWLRSIKFKNGKSYLLVLDIDSNEFNRRILEGSKGLYRTIVNYLHKKPLFKVSGSKGVQIILKVNFDEVLDEHLANRHLCNLAYTLWRISTPNVRATIHFDEVPGIDCAMFTKGRMLRSFCRHLVTGNFSVPIDIEDSFEDVRRRMNLEVPLMDFMKFPEIDFDESLVIYEYTGIAERQKMFITESDMKKLENTTAKGFQPDKIYGRMPMVLRKLVRSSKIPRDLKWPLIVYLRIFERMKPPEILEWLLNHSGWEDLSDLKISLYQIQWTCEWCDKTCRKMVKNDRYMVRSIPLPERFLDELIDYWDKRLNGRAFKVITKKFFEYNREVLATRPEDEKNEESQIAQ